MSRRSAALAGSLLLVAATAHAVVVRNGPRIAAETLTALPAAGLTKPLRVQPTFRYGHGTGAAWTKLAATGSWTASWDAATGVPNRIWGSGIRAPGSNADPLTAERIARGVLADHLALLAPGASLADFELVSNHTDGDIRSIGFVQRASGRRVVGGQVNFRFKKDRLFVIGSEALPNVHVVDAKRLSAKSLRDRAIGALRRELALPDAPVSDAGDELVLPLVADAAVLGYRVVRPMTIDGSGAGRYLAYADAATGAVIAVHQQNEFATGTVMYHAVDRYPAKPRVDRPAPRAHVMVGSSPQTTTDTGTVTWNPEISLAITTSVAGDLVGVANQAAGNAHPAAVLTMAPGGSVVWDASAVVEDDAQVQVYLNINIAKAFVRSALDPAMPTLDDALVANANIDDNCNAFFDSGSPTKAPSVNFYHATLKCQNTGLLQDVVFHEFGHDVHFHEVIAGVGAIDGGMGEGVADFFAASITGDHGLGPGFFYTDAPLRDLDPPDKEYKYPDDLGEVHTTGLIFGGIFWDLRTALIAQYGPDEGAARVLALFLAAIRRSVNIPTTLIEVLAADDDDGDLSNGTPNECLIRGVYARHGLHGATGSVAAPGALQIEAPSVAVVVSLTDLVSRCHTDDISDVKLDWAPGPLGVPAAGEVLASPIDGSKFYAQLPLAPHDDVYYKAIVEFADGSTIILPDNRADPLYQLYDGITVPLYCTRFDTDPFTEGWTTGTDDESVPSPWKWRELAGGASNPEVPFSGTRVLSQAPGGDYAASSYSFVKMPTIDIGQYSDVRLQYRRWLTVEDSHFDQARIVTNNVQAWANFNSNAGDMSNTEHLDLEWRFHDVPLTGFFLGHKLDIMFDLKSDEGLEFGGWNLDDLCVVANPASICGDGVKSPTEECDEGSANGDVADACRTYCRRPTCGDGIVDSNEQCDGGPDGDPACSDSCHLVALYITGGCCSGSGGGTGSIVLAGLVLGLGLRRRRRPRL